MKPGDSYFIDGHLWVAVSHFAADGSVAMVNFTTHREPCDESCVLYPGDHPFIKHKTIVSYHRAQIVSASGLVLVKRQPPGVAVSRAILQRIQQGALASDATPPKVEAAIKIALGAK